MTARFVLEDTVSRASVSEAQRYCTCSDSLKVTGTRFCNRSEKACSRFSVTPGACTLPKAGKIDAGLVAEVYAALESEAEAWFHEEGLARQYLRINGHWADHLLFALLRADYDTLLRAAR